MRLLLDTNVFIWSMTDPGRLGRRAALIEDRGNEILVSVASAWEIAIKNGLGKFPLPEPVDRYVPDAIRRLRAQTVTVSLTHALAVAELPPLHRDPFDRLLVAQAVLLDATLVTGDSRLAAYPADTIVV